MVENNRFIRCFLFEGKGSNKFSINKFYNLLKLNIISCVKLAH
ncbi:hypothetical protein CAPSP0001_0938 [Capnocytophaga sputigena ATCC 33612]|nr:hypothetical protein CAPSP0001_0938 [Capnocytophaga sputigena ATCC 33612]